MAGMVVLVSLESDLLSLALQILHFDLLKTYFPEGLRGPRQQHPVAWVPFCPLWSPFSSRPFPLKVLCSVNREPWPRP